MDPHTDNSNTDGGTRGSAANVWRNIGALNWVRTAKLPIATEVQSSTTVAERNDIASAHQSANCKPITCNPLADGTDYVDCMVCRLNIARHTFERAHIQSKQHLERLTTFIERQKQKCIAIYTLMSCPIPLHRCNVASIISADDNDAHSSSCAPRVELHHQPSTTTTTTTTTTPLSPFDAISALPYHYGIPEGKDLWCRFCQTTVPNTATDFLGYGWHTIMMNRGTSDVLAW
jgi:Zn finger protein HypA/HybF involved in hydrogenase expression